MAPVSVSAPASSPSLPDQPTLTGEIVELQPLRRDHAAALLAAAADGELWNLTVTVVPGPDLAAVDTYIGAALAGRDAGTVLPFVIVQRASGRIVGTTRFWRIDLVHRTMEIGSTWLSRFVQRSAVNTEAKYLLLTQAFEVMSALRVQFMTDELNEKSRTAILRLGAKQEGIIRHERIMPDGRRRNSVLYSIIDSEWPTVKAGLRAKLGR